MNTTEAQDPLDEAVQTLFGLSFLFPYQRLVISNILEAAEAAGIVLYWPGVSGGDVSGVQGLSGETPDSGDPSDEPSNIESGMESDRESAGRQIVILPTGAGKSLCFQLPAMIMERPTLVIYPILGLMADQERRLRERGFSPVTLRGGQTREERDAVWEQLRSGRSKFLIANPEVLITPGVLGRLESLRIAHVVIDEAHCVSEWGETFRPAYLEIGKIIEASKATVVTAFTATASAPVLAKIESGIFGDRGARRIIGNPGRANISYAARGCILRDIAVRDMLLANERPALVFCSSRPGTEQLARYLRNEMRDMGAAWYEDIRFYHAGLSREEKTEVESWFLHHEEAVLVTTCAFGMGIDKAGIRTVIHRDCPPSVEAYLQESGRAGRDGLPSRAVLLWGPGDEFLPRRAATENGKKRIEEMLAYARNTKTCRRDALLGMLNYEGEQSAVSLCCDVCEHEARTTLREEASLVDFFRRNKRLYTPVQASRVIAAAPFIRCTEKEAARAVQHLIAAGKLAALNNPFWKNKLIPVPAAKHGLPG